MSKLTRREYAAVAKRPGARGAGFAPTGRPRVVVTDDPIVTGFDNGEDSNPDIEDLGKGEVKIYPFTEEGIKQVGRDLADTPLSDAAEINLTDLAEQEVGMEVEEANDAEAAPPTVEVKPMGFSGSSINGKGGSL